MAVWVHVLGTNRKLEFSLWASAHIAVEPVSPAILTGTQVEFGTNVGTTEKGGSVCS